MTSSILSKLNKLKILERLNIIEYKINQFQSKSFEIQPKTDSIEIDKLKIEIDYIKNILSDHKNQFSNTDIQKDIPQLISYLSFEDKFRGSKSVITNRQKLYLKYFLNKKNILDLGCGRGEFLQLLEQENIICLGIDNNQEMIFLCQKNGLNVRNSSLFDYLKSCPNNIHGGITAFQVIEHIETNRIPEFVYLCFKKITRNGVVVVETINPHCLQALANFWADLTHQKPIVPLTLKHIFEEIGFSKVNIIGRTPVHPHAKDFKLNPPDLTVYGDYAIVATK